MEYIGYKFKMSEDGLTFHDINTALEPHQRVNINTTPFNVGDTFMLTTDANECMHFKRVDIVVDGKDISMKEPQKNGD
jgi:hypothetical protein|tara:strand:+ start:91 stop:324 length:234 start_codon:yes stop_codon:yes gene_type:complete